MIDAGETTAPETPAGDDDAQIGRAIEALLFLSPEPLALETLCELTESAPGPVQRALARVGERHDASGGLELAEVAGGWALRTRNDLAEVCDRLRRRPREETLSPAALETLAVVAYLEPISRPRIGRLRGVQVDGIVSALVERGLLEEAGREGGAVLYRTTRAFQERFDLADRGVLPPLESFELSGPEADAIRAQLIEGGHLSAEDPVDDGG